MSWILQSLEKYAEFNGRSRRTEYWMFQLFSVMGMLLIGFISGIDELGDLLVDVPFLPMVFLIGIITPHLSLSVRRLHDTSHSGGLVLIGLIPILGFLILFYLLGFQDSDLGENKYGPNPKSAGIVPPKPDEPETTQIEDRTILSENYSDELLEKITEEEFVWITNFAIQIKPRLPRILTYDPGNYGHRGLSKDPKLSYLRNLRYSLHIGPLLELRRDFPKTKVKKLPTAEWFADNVVPKPRDIPYGISYPQEEEHLRWGNILREEFDRSLKLENKLHQHSAKKFLKNGKLG